MKQTTNKYKAHITRPISIYLLLLLFPFSQIKGQGMKPLRVNDHAPDFTVSEMSNFSRSTAKLEDFRGKWLVLDFWSRGCLACIQGFPKLNELAAEFSGKALFLLIGNNSKRYNKGIAQLYQKIEKASHLQLTAGFDSLVFQHYQISTVPHVVIIDPGGKIRAITYSGELSKKKLEDFFSGKAVNWVTKPGTVDDPQMLSEDKSVSAILIHKSQGLAPHESKIVQWKSTDPVEINLNFLEGDSIKAYQTTCTSLSRLYLMAYLGIGEWDSNDSHYLSTWKTPVIEVSDTSHFKQDFLHATGLYNYDLNLSFSQGKRMIMNAMQEDLKQLFGYQATIENREMPYLKLVKMDPDRPFTRSNLSRKLQGDPGGYVFEGIYLTDLVHVIINYQPHQVFIDNTDIDYPINLKLDADMTSIYSINEGLEQQGLKLLTSIRTFQVLVIRDTKDSKNMP